MILVDTTVLINYFKGIKNEKSLLFDSIINKRLPYGISSYTYQELLQGARDEKEYSELKKYLSTQIIYLLPEELQTYEDSARMYFDLRRKGITIRSTIDVLVALTAIRYSLFLLHDDRDFDMFAKNIAELMILNYMFQ